MPGFAELRKSTYPSDAMLLDRHGKPLQTLRVDPRQRRLEWIALDQVSPALRLALLASEDRRFYAHAGVDWSAVAAAGWANLWNTRTRGASTITMQLAGLLDEDLRRRSAPRSVSQKISQVLLARSLERQWRKDQILEAYLNLVSFRGELVGVAALSRVLFDKHPSGLDQLEAALAVALIRAPNASPAKVAARACVIHREQLAQASAAWRAGVSPAASSAVSAPASTAPAPSCSALEGLAALRLVRLPAPQLTAQGAQSGLPSAYSPSAQLAPHLARRLLKLPGPPQRSSLDAGLQQFARDTLRRHLAELAGRNVADGAVLVLDNRSGEVLAWVGSSGTLSAAPEVDGVLALRQAGSTLKPFLYALAIENRWLTAASLLDDSPLNLPTGAGLYVPQNYDRSFKGAVSLRTALGSSLNVPAVRTVVSVTPQRLFQRLQALGFGLRESGDYYGYSLALGSADVSLLALTNGYRALANQGRYGPVHYTPSGAYAAVGTASTAGKPRGDKPGSVSAAGTAGKAAFAGTVSASGSAASSQVIDPAAAFIIADILADRSARARTFGLENALATRGWSAVKTGTSKDMRDNWCIGFSSRYTVGVWVGNATGAPMWDVSGVTGSAPVWQDVMQFLHEGAPAPTPLPPPGVSALAIRYQDEVEAPRREYFMHGTALAVIHPLQVPQMTNVITSPAAGTVIALDPDIPPARQRLRFSAVGHDRKSASWHLDGKPPDSRSGSHVQPGSLDFDWMPWPGKHVLTLHGKDGRELDRVRFEVRGATLRSAGPIAAHARSSRTAP